MGRPLNLPAPPSEPQSNVASPLPREVLDRIISFTDMHTLVSMSAASAGMRSLAKESFTSAVHSTLLQFMPAAKVTHFFACLSEVQGVIFGDVPLRVQLRTRWRLWGMHMAVPHGNSVPVVGWFLNCGYSRRPVSKPHSWGTCHIYGLQNDAVSLFAPLDISR